MSILGSLIGRILRGRRDDDDNTASSGPTPTQATIAAARASVEQQARDQAARQQGQTATAPGEARSFQPVDIEPQLDALAQQSDQKLNWRTSIVDLMKLLDIDSSLQNRKELAKELGYTGDTDDSASMNIWLHKQVMAKVAANGGKVPANLAD